ncbi:hypothetical protein ACFL4W_01605 [Planctomycetota bacterium]
MTIVRKNSDDWPMAAAMKHLLGGVMLAVLILAAAIHSGCGRSDKDESAGDKGQGQPKPQSVAEPEPVSPGELARQAFEAAEKFLTENPEKLKEARAYFDEIAVENPGSEWGQKGLARAKELLEQQIRRDFDAWVAVTKKGTAEQVLDGYEQFEHVWGSNDMINEANGVLGAWLEHNTHFSVNVIPDSLASDVMFGLNYEGKIPEEKVRFSWRINKRRVSREKSFRHHLEGKGPYPVQVTARVRKYDLFTREFEVDLIGDAFALWRVWVGSFIKARPGFNKPHFNITRNDDQMFLAYKTPEGYVADIRLGRIVIPEQEVTSSVPAVPREEQLLKELETFDDPRDIDHFLHLQKSQELPREVTQAMLWWAVYLKPGSADYQSKLGFIRDCQHCKGTGTVKSLGVVGCTACKALGRKKCLSCRGESRLKCPRGHAGGYILEKTYLTKNRDTEKMAACPVCRGKGWVLCRHCKGELPQLCKNCRRRGPVGKACPLCMGEKPELIPADKIEFPFFTYAKSNPGPELDKARKMQNRQGGDEQPQLPERN